MKNVYPVLFTKTTTNILVEVPDLDILTEGKDMCTRLKQVIIVSTNVSLWRYSEYGNQKM